MNYLEEKNVKNPEDSRVLITIMGDSAVLDGKFKISQSIDIDCEVKGKLNVDGKLTILKNGFVSADVKTIDAEIIGTYEGNMEASGYVEIKETGVVNGTVKTNSLIINKGGVFSGNVARISEGDEKSKKKGKAARINIGPDAEGIYDEEETYSADDEGFEEISENEKSVSGNEEGLSL